MSVWRPPRYHKKFQQNMSPFKFVKLVSQMQNNKMYFCVQAFSVIVITAFPVFFPFQKQHTHKHTHTCVWLESPHPSSCWPGNTRLVQWRAGLTPQSAFFRHTHTHTEPTQCVLTWNEDIHRNKTIKIKIMNYKNVCVCAHGVRARSPRFIVCTNTALDKHWAI